MKRIVICFDGTWSRPADEDLPTDQQVETNARRFFESVIVTGSDGVNQVKWYDQGVGANWYDRFFGGAFGAGLERNIIDGYKFLSHTHQDGDEVYLLGFSRGAYTARSLAGMIRNCGLIKSDFLDLKVGIAYGIYRTADDGPDSLTARLFRSAFAKEIEIKFVGVWDTVGALGIPLNILNQFNMRFYEFHDTRLSKIVKNAYQAIAVDEHRKDYLATLWDPTESPQQTIEQRWFIGAHSDVGGGYLNRRLSDLTLRWMQDRASAVGLKLIPVEVMADNYLAPYTDSYSAFLNGVYAKIHPRHFRSIGVTPFGREIIDESVRNRLRDDPGYQPLNPGF
jgi:uncharacterized protein (DUF2235 family)